MAENRKAIKQAKSYKKVFGSIIIITPDRSKIYQDFIEQLKKENVSGIWRVLNQK